eukprot:4254104-Karenia_brevis.AAC.1
MRHPAETMLQQQCRRFFWARQRLNQCLWMCILICMYTIRVILYLYPIVCGLYMCAYDVSVLHVPTCGDHAPAVSATGNGLVGSAFRSV